MSHWGADPALPTAGARVAAIGLVVGAALAGTAAAQRPGLPPPGACPASPTAETGGAGIHAAFDGLLRAFVRDGQVDYRCFQAHEALLDGYLATLAGTNPATLSRDAAMALWINAYNAFTIKLILSRYPRIESIKDIPRRWDRRDWLIGGRRYSLNDIEHRILRKQFAEPRIHFAIVCASASCPELVPEAYLAGRLDEQLTGATRRFLADHTRGFRAELEPRGTGRPGARAHLSAIFKWFREDFEGPAGSLIDFVARYLRPEDRDFLGRHREELSIRFLPYDWSLNGS